MVTEAGFEPEPTGFPNSQMGFLKMDVTIRWWGRGPGRPSVLLQGRPWS